MREGDLLAGKYAVGAVLGRGGIGVVIAATHTLLHQKVAIKLLSSAGASEEIVKRFLREGQAAARLKGEHVARVLDMGQLPNGSPYMVMEYLEGQDLGALLDQQGALPVQEAVEYVIHACEAMAEAHAAGIVHRDLKPANLFLTAAADGTKQVKVVDFGISKDLEGSNDYRLTGTTTVMGSPLYMSPEQMRSARDADARSDIWALGVILYELLTGQPPFDAGHYPELVYKVTTCAPPPPTSLRRDLPGRIELVIQRCLEKSPDKRFADVGLLAAALLPFAPPRAKANVERIQRLLDAAPSSRASLLPRRASEVPGRPSGAGRQSRASMSWTRTAEPARDRRGRRAVFLIAAAGITLAAAGGALMIVRRAPPTTAEIAPAEEPAAVMAAPPAIAPRAQAEPSPPVAEETPATPEPRPLAEQTPKPAPRTAGATQMAATRGSTPAAPPAPATAAAPPPAPPAAAPASKNPLDLTIK